MFFRLQGDSLTPGRPEEESAPHVAEQAVPEIPCKYTRMWPKFLFYFIKIFDVAQWSALQTHVHEPRGPGFEGDVPVYLYCPVYVNKNPQKYNKKYLIYFTKNLSGPHITGPGTVFLETSQAVPKTPRPARYLYCLVRSP